MPRKEKQKEPGHEYLWFHVSRGTRVTRVARLWYSELGFPVQRGYQATSKCGQQCSHVSILLWVYSVLLFVQIGTLDIMDVNLVMNEANGYLKRKYSSELRLVCLQWGSKMSSSWQPNPNAKPFTPASAYFALPSPCRKIRIRKKGFLSRIIQWILVIVLCVTVVINFIFIWDTTKKYSRDRNALMNSNTAEGTVSQLERNEKTGTVFKFNLCLTDLVIHRNAVHLRLERWSNKLTVFWNWRKVFTMDKITDEE